MQFSSEDKSLNIFSQALSDYANREMMKQRFERLLKASPSLKQVWAKHDDERQLILLKLLTLGQAAIDEVVRLPHLLPLLLTEAFLVQIFENNPSPRSRLATFKTFAWLKIVLADRCRFATIKETMNDLSRLADRVCLEAFENTGGFPAGLSLWAMGKWGGLELNASSDIDPIFFRDDNMPPEEADQAVRKWLAVMTPERDLPIYPVDLRLRPEGDAGPLVSSYHSLEKYLFERAAPWERIAYLRARRVQGFEPPWLGEMLDNYLFITDFDPKKRQHEVARGLATIRKNARADDIKRGPGGIRDIEFLVASIQLVTGQEHPEFRGGNIHDLLHKTHAKGVITQKEFSILWDAYTLFRNIEHALQIENDRACFILPEAGSPSFLLLSDALSIPPDKLESHINSMRLEVKRIVDREFGFDQKSMSAVTGYDPQSEDSLQDKSEDDMFSWMSNRQVKALVRRLSGKWGTAQELIDFSILNEANDKLETLTRLESAINSFGGAKNWVRTFGQRRHLIRDITSIFVHAPKYSDEAINRPYLIEQLAWSEIPQIPETSDLSKLSDFLGNILFKLSVSFHQLEIDFNEMTRQWTSTVDQVIINLAHDSFSTNSPPVSILALGKWGGQELAPEGDLDLMFVCDTKDYTQLAGCQQFVLTWMNKAAVNGRLSLDARLRPEGSGAPMVINLDRLQDYLSTRAQGWEKIALMRARFVAGDQTIADKALDILQEFTTIEPDDKNWKILHRARQEAAKLRGNRRQISIKKSRGGMMDFEFATAFASWQLKIDKGEFWSLPIVKRMQQINQQTKDDIWQQAIEYYGKLRNWEIRLNLSNTNRRGLLSFADEEHHLPARTLGLSPDALESEWKEISSFGKDLYDKFSGQ